MHEMSIAMNIIDIACREAAKENAEAITVIEIDVGTLSGVMVDSLTFCYEAACKDTLAEDSVLKINEIPAQAHCKHCNVDFPIDAFMALCPTCNGYEIEINQGRELRLKAVNVT